MNLSEPETGSLLVAEPFMWDPNFKRTVALLCENHPENGAFGFVLNRKLEMKLHEAINGIKKFDAPLYYGGPVELDTLHFLHQLEDLEGAIMVCEGVYWGGNFDAVKRMINNREVKPSDFRFFLGYSGWGTEQLADELKEKSWIVHAAKSKHIFKTPPDELWKQILKEKGGEYTLMVNYPEDPSYN